MGNRFSVFVPRKSDGVYEHVFGGSVGLRTWSRDVLKSVLSPVNQDTGSCSVTNIPEFARVVEHERKKVDRALDQPWTEGAYERYLYWSHLADVSRIALAFLDHGVDARIDVG